MWWRRRQLVFNRAQIQVNVDFDRAITTLIERVRRLEGSEARDAVELCQQCDAQPGELHLSLCDRFPRRA